MVLASFNLLWRLLNLAVARFAGTNGARFCTAPNESAVGKAVQIQLQSILKANPLSPP
jgi:hypothetical protein